MGFMFGTSPAAKKAAKATALAAENTARNDRLMSQAAQQSRETINAQDVASRAAAELLGKPQGTVDIQVAPDGQQAGVDPATGRKRTTRSTFSSSTASASGIRL